MRAALLLLCALPALSQTRAGELRLSVVDATGKALESTGLLASQSTHVRQPFTTDREGRYIAAHLPFGTYRLQVERPGFSTFAGLIDIRSELPLSYSVTLGVAPIETTVTVTDSDTLLDPHRTGAVSYIGSESLQDRPASQPGRDVIDLIQRQPGWLLEANGVLHPRGAEYDTQYVIDGLPLVDNRSPAFAPSIDVEDLDSINVMTSGYSAEYGRKLGGVVEVTTARPSAPGLHGKAVLQGGSFETVHGYVSGQYTRGRTTASLSGEVGHTARYLDPPVEANYSNNGNLSGVGGYLERDFNDHDRLRVSLQQHRSGFLVPNEQVQQAAGQRQDRTSGETTGLVFYQHVFSPRILAAVRGMVRDLSSNLWSNPQSTPIEAFQQRGFREGYVNASVSGHFGAHEVKAGGEASFASVREQFAYHITNYQLNGQPIFDPGTPGDLQFADRRKDREQSAYVQDLIRAGRFTFSAGVRGDHYRLLVDESAVSPRLGVSWYAASLGLVLRASYDRIFQTPAFENILLSSSPQAQAINDKGVFLPVRPSRGNQYEAGFAKSLFGKLRWTGAYYKRDLSNFGDDSLLLNTGITFPIALHSVNIYGFESQLELPRAGPVSGFISYSNLLGRSRFPIAGGLFLDDNAAALLRSNEQFPITQDQRNTARARLRYQLAPRVWTAWGANYGSGLPTEQAGLDADTLREQFGARVVDRVNLDRGRVRPSFSVDASIGADVWQQERRSVRLQFDVLNVTDRLNVINFAGVFSGTALAPPRSFSIRLLNSF